MSEKGPPRGSDTRKANAGVRITSEAKEKLDRLSKSTKLTMSVILGTIIDMVVEAKTKGVDLLREDWQEAFLETQEKVDRYEFLDKACPALTFDDEKYVCVWGQEDKPPMIRKLSKTEDGARALCVSCTETLDRSALIQENRELKARIKDGVYIKIPFCEWGGQLKETDRGFQLECKDPKKSTQFRSVEKFCKKVQGGSRCKWLKERTITGRIADKNR